MSMHHELDEPLYTDPLPWFQAWLKDASMASIPEYNACCFATVSQKGQPSARMVLLKEHGEDGFVVYTNLESRKGQQALAHPLGALTFHWRSLGRQIRIEGALVQVEDARADAYFATRSRGSQLGAWASHQSRPLESRAALEARARALERRFEDLPIPRPACWSGFLLVPELIEFWSNGEHRLHDRFEFRRETPESAWSIQRLNP